VPSSSNWVTNEVLGTLKTGDRTLAECLVTTESLTALIRLIDAGTISGKIAKDVFSKMWETGNAPQVIVERYARGRSDLAGSETLTTPAVVPKQLPVV
jgi:Asp-tRNA(Asn)/Glu-tRNA(Gln) amidotransferase B subunit